MATMTKKDARRQRVEERQSDAQRARLQKDLRAHPFVGLFSPDLQERIMTEDGQIDEMRPLFGRLMVLARRHPERLLELPALAELDELRLAIRRQYFTAVKTLDAGSWFDQLINRPISETLMKMYSQDGIEPTQGVAKLHRQLTGKLTELLRHRTDVIKAQSEAKSTGGTNSAKAKAQAARRSRQLERSRSGPAKGVNPAAQKFGGGKKKSK